MKRITFIISIIIVNSGSLMAYMFSGIYVAPKIEFYPEKRSYDNKYDYYAGGAVALGYDFFKLQTQIPVRVELEYTGKVNFSAMNEAIHSLMVGAYYDLNLFYVTANELNTLTTRGLYTTKRPFMSLYLGVHFGARFAYQITGKTNEMPFVQTTMGTSRTSFIFAAGAGLAWHFTSWFALDLGYRFVIGQGFKNANEVLISFRFTMP